MLGKLKMGKPSVSPVSPSPSCRQEDMCSIHLLLLLLLLFELVVLCKEERGKGRIEPFLAFSLTS